MLATFGGGADSHRAFTDNTGTVTLGGLSGGNTTSDYGRRASTSSREGVDLPVGAMQSADVALRSEQKTPKDPSGPTASADGVSNTETSAQALRRGHEEDRQRPPRRYAIVPESSRRISAIRASLRNARRQSVSSEKVGRSSESGKQAAEIDPRLAMPHALLGKIYVQQGKYNEAETQLLEASRLDPKSWEAPYELARCYCSMKQFDKAMNVGLRVHEMPGAPTTVRLLMVDLYGAVHDLTTALRELEEFSKADPQSPYMAAVKRRIDTLKKN